MGQALTEREIEAIVREVTDEEVAFYHYTVHGGPPNSTDKPRWSYLFSYAPSDTRYWNGTAANWGSERKRLSDPNNPTVHFSE